MQIRQKCGTYTAENTAISKYFISCSLCIKNEAASKCLNNVTLTYKMCLSFKPEMHWWAHGIVLSSQLYTSQFQFLLLGQNKKWRDIETLCPKPSLNPISHVREEKYWTCGNHVKWSTCIWNQTSLLQNPATNLRIIWNQVLKWSFT